MRNTKCRKPKADYHFCQLQHRFQGMVEGRGKGAKLWLIYLSICRRQQKANNASNAQNIPKGKACEWHKKRQAATIQKLQLLTLLNLHVFSFCFWTAQTFLGLVWARTPVPIDPPHQSLSLIARFNPNVQTPYAIYFCYFSFFWPSHVQIYTRSKAFEELDSARRNDDHSSLKSHMLRLRREHALAHAHATTINLPHLHKMPWCLKKHLEYIA